MSTRLYWVTLVVLIKAAHRYATRYQSQMALVLSPTKYQCVVDLITALDTCIVALGEPPVNP